MSKFLSFLLGRSSINNRHQQDEISQNQHSRDAGVKSCSRDCRRMEDCHPSTIDEMLRYRAELSGDSPLISYPSSATEYRDYSARDVNVFAYRAAQAYEKELAAKLSSDGPSRVIGLLGPPSFEFVIAMFALWKLGHTVALLSPRLSLDAYEYLINKIDATDVIFDKSFNKVADKIHNKMSAIAIHELVPEERYDGEINGEELERATNVDHKLRQKSSEVAVIVHSSGSTGLPKPIKVTHKGLLQAAEKNMDMNAFSCVPFFHLFGLNGLNRTIYSGKQYWMFNATLPLTRKYLTEIILKIEVGLFFCVPYALKLMAETEDGSNALKRCKLVWYGGSACPDGIGDRLNSKGVKLIGDYGLTECGPLMSTQRPDSDGAWNYLRPLPHVKPFIKWEERDGGLYELVCLKDLPSKIAHNRDDGSYATNDLFARHPTIENAFKFVTRQDDTLVLANGEKANPVNLENKVKQHEFVTEAVVFGAGKTELGLMLVKSPAAQDLTWEEIVEEIWPMVEQGQVDMPGHGKIVKPMVSLLPSDSEFPRTLKGSLIRHQFYKQYATEIEDAYQEKEGGKDRMTLREDKLREFVRREIIATLSIDDESTVTDDADLFQLGIDSLQSTQLRRTFQTRLDLGGQQLSNNVVYENPSIGQLIAILHGMGHGHGDSGSRSSSHSRCDVFQLISRHGSFSKHSITDTEQCYLLTGATGSLGTHLLGQLLVKDNVTKVYCLVRAKTSDEAQKRVAKALQDRNIDLSEAQVTKVQALAANLAAPLLGLKGEEYRTISLDVTAVIHAAWPVNFRLSLSSFESEIVGARQLIELCLSSQRTKPASFAFCSSISTMLRYGSEKDVPETLPPSDECALDMGYAQSKLVAEHLCVNAARQAGLRSYVFRIGQIIGDTAHGIWKNDEATPLMLQTAQTLGALPKLEDEQCRWLPVDTVAKTMLDILLEADAPGGSVFNIVNPTSFNFAGDLLPKLHTAKLEFDEVSRHEWLSRLQDSEQDARANPPVKLVGYFESMYGQPSRRDSAVDVDRQYEAPTRDDSLTWTTDNSAKYSQTFREGWNLDQEMVEKMLAHWQKNCWNKQPKVAQSEGSDSG